MLFRFHSLELPLHFRQSLVELGVDLFPISSNLIVRQLFADS